MKFALLVVVFAIGQISAIASEGEEALKSSNGIEVVDANSDKLKEILRSKKSAMEYNLGHSHHRQIPSYGGSSCGGRPSYREAEAEAEVPFEADEAVAYANPAQAPAAPPLAPCPLNYLVNCQPSVVPVPCVNSAPAAQPSYGPAPAAAQPSYGPAPAPQPSYGPAPAPQASYGPAPAPQHSYGPAPAPQPSYGPAPASHASYGAAPAPRPSYGAAPAPQASYGPAPAPRPSYGAAPAPQSSYGPAPAPQPASYREAAEQQKHGIAVQPGFEAEDSQADMRNKKEPQVEEDDQDHNGSEVERKKHKHFKKF